MERSEWYRLSSAAKVGYRSLPLTFLATSAFDAEVFAKNPDNDGLNRVQSGVEVQWRPMPQLTLRLEQLQEYIEHPLYSRKLGEDEIDRLVCGLRDIAGTDRGFPHSEPVGLRPALT